MTLPWPYKKFDLKVYNILQTTFCHLPQLFLSQPSDNLLTHVKAQFTYLLSFSSAILNPPAVLNSK